MTIDKIMRRIAEAIDAGIAGGSLADFLRETEDDIDALTSDAYDLGYEDGKYEFANEYDHGYEEGRRAGYDEGYSAGLDA